MVGVAPRIEVLAARQAVPHAVIPVAEVAQDAAAAEVVAVDAVAAGDGAAVTTCGMKNHPRRIAYVS